jgi:hypothetical protein
VDEGLEPGSGLPDDRALSREVHESALERKGVRGRCEACGADAWATGERLLLVHVLDGYGNFVPGRGVEAVSVYCRRCGLLRLHAANLLLRDE